MSFREHVEKWLGRAEENRKAFASLAEDAVRGKLNIERKAEMLAPEGRKAFSSLAISRGVIGEKAGYAVLGMMDEAFREWKMNAEAPDIVSRLYAVVIETLSEAMEKKDADKEAAPGTGVPTLRTRPAIEKFFRNIPPLAMKPGLEFRIEDLSPLGRALIEKAGSPTMMMVDEIEETEKELASYYRRYLADSDSKPGDDDVYMDIASRHGEPAAGMALLVASKGSGDAYHDWLEALFEVLDEDDKAGAV